MPVVFRRGALLKIEISFLESEPEGVRKVMRSFDPVRRLKSIRRGSERPRRLWIRMGYLATQTSLLELRTQSGLRRMWT
jgi:hypothetical protein